MLIIARTWKASMYNACPPVVFHNYWKIHEGVVDAEQALMRKKAFEFVKKQVAAIDFRDNLIPGCFLQMLMIALQQIYSSGVPYLQQ